MNIVWVRVASGLLVVIAIGCGGGQGPRVVASEPETQVAAAAADRELAERYGHCSLDDFDGVDRPSSFDFVQGVAHWLRLGTGAREELRALLGREEGLDVDLNVAALRALDSPGVDERRRVSLHWRHVAGIVAALDDGHVVIVGVSDSTDDFPNSVRVALVLTSDDAVFFAGDCHRQFYDEPFRERYGDAFAETMRAAVGKTGDDLRAVLSPEPPVPVLPPVVLLNPSSVSANVLDPLAHVLLHITVPPGWVGPFIMCTKIALGWNDCIDLAIPVAAGARTLDIYLDESGRLEVWFLEPSVSLRTPLQLLGVVTMPEPTDNKQYEIVVTGTLDADQPAVEQPSVQVIER